MRNSTIFRSRWFALLWSAGILWIAYDVAAPDIPESNETAHSTDVTGDPISEKDAAQIGQMINDL
ncbi:MAG: hypothetical protein ACJ8EY_00560 [Sphingomicrobium sp.]